MSSKSSKRATAFVTGCSTGIGEATVKLLAEKDWIVFAGVRKEADAARLKELSPNVKPVLVDVTNEEQVARAAEEVRVATGDDGLDVLVNNAGLVCGAPVEFMPLSVAMKQFEVNLFGYIRMIQAMMPLLRAGSPGRVINIGSTGANMQTPYIGIYQSTKSAVMTMSESFRREVARSGIKVSLVQPGPVKTNLENTALDEHAKLKEMFPKGSPCEKLYGKDIDHLPEATKPLMKHMIDPKYVAQRIYQAMTVKNPKNIYYDTWGSYFTTLMMHWFPVSWVDSMFAGMMFAKD